MPLGHNLKHLPMGSGGLYQSRSFCHLVFELFLIRWLSQYFYRMGLGKKGWGLVSLQSLLTLKFRFSIKQALSEVFTSIPSIIIIYAPGHNLQRLLPDPGGLCRHQSFCYLVFDLFSTRRLYRMKTRKEIINEKRKIK